jgi:hypothetical protein
MLRHILAALLAAAALAPFAAAQTIAIKRPTLDFAVAGTGVLTAHYGPCSTLSYEVCQLNYQQCAALPVALPWLDDVDRGVAACRCWAQQWVCYSDCGVGFPAGWAASCAKACPAATYPGACAPATQPGAA